MKYCFLILCFSVCLLANETKYAPKDYSLVWQDTFNRFDKSNWSRGLESDNSKLSVIWNSKTGGKSLLNSQYAGYITDEDSYVKNGTLVLRNQKRVYKGQSPDRQFQYTSGWINSLGKRKINGTKTPVYLEIKAKFPTGLKVWPAIWLVTEQRKWPPEIDIWEYFGYYWNGNDKMYMRYIYPTSKQQTWLKKNHSESSIPINNYHRDYNAEAWHIYGWEWNDKKMVWTIDGKVVRILKRSSIKQFWPNEHFSFVINNGIITNTKGKDNTKWPNYLILDYLTVSEKSK